MAALKNQSNIVAHHFEAIIAGADLHQISN